MQIQYDLEGIVEQQWLDLWGHTDTVYPFITSKTHREEPGQWGYKAKLRICETQAGIRLGNIEPGVPRYDWIDSCAGTLAHGFVRLTNYQRNFRFIR
ncbi:hypothetical protein D3C81_1960960 [compost metagenome]